LGLRLFHIFCGTFRGVSMNEFENFFLRVYIELLANKLHNLRSHCESGLNDTSLVILGEIESMVEDLLDVCRVAAGEDPSKE